MVGVQQCTMVGCGLWVKANAFSSLDFAMGRSHACAIACLLGDVFMGMYDHPGHMSLWLLAPLLLPSVKILSDDHASLWLTNVAW